VLACLQDLGPEGLCTCAKGECLEGFESCCCVVQSCLSEEHSCKWAAFELWLVPPWNAAPEKLELVALPPWDFQLTMQCLSQEGMTLKGEMHLAVVSKPEWQG